MTKYCIHGVSESKDLSTYMKVQGVSGKHLTCNKDKNIFSYKELMCIFRKFNKYVLYVDADLL